MCSSHIRLAHLEVYENYTERYKNYMFDIFSDDTRTVVQQSLSLISITYKRLDEP